MAAQIIDGDIPSNVTQVNASEMMAAVSRVETAAFNIPTGYTKIVMSTENRLYAPAEVYVRNFDTKDLIPLAVTEMHNLPETLVSLLDEMIWVPNPSQRVSVGQWHENEVLELIVKIYMTFFSKQLIDVDFPLTNEDYNYLETRGDPVAKQMLMDIKAGKLKPKTTIDLSKMKLYKLPEDFKNSITVRRKTDGTVITFNYPRFADVVKVKKALNEMFAKEEKAYNSIKQKLEYRRKIEEELKSGNKEFIPADVYISEAEINNYQNYELRKAKAGVDLIRAASLKKLNGVDYTGEPLSARLEQIQNFNFDITLSTTIQSMYDKLEAGIYKVVPMYNPLRRVEEMREFPFRLIDILSAIKSYKSDEYDIVDDSENELHDK